MSIASGGSMSTRKHVNDPVNTVEYGVSVNDPRRVALLRQRCEMMLRIFPGDVLEAGVYRGGTLLVLAEVIRKQCPDRKVIGVDTFEGHPHTDGHPVHPVGKYSNVDLDALRALICQRGLTSNVQLIKGRVEEILPKVDCSQVSFAHVDCDLYTSVLACCKYLKRSMPPWGVIFIDDFFHEHCPGATAAVTDIFGKCAKPIFLPDDGTEWSCEIPLRSFRRCTMPLVTLNEVSAPRGALVSDPDVLHKITFSIKEGELTSIVGPSASGKTTLLYVLAGIIDAPGVVRSDELKTPGAIGMLFQSDILFPWMTVAKNLDLAIRLTDKESTSRRQRIIMIKKVLDAVGLEEYAADGSRDATRMNGIAGRRYENLSGGEKRRVSLAAALVHDSRLRLLLLDEPTSQFDFLLKADIQELLYRLWDKRGFAAVVVTHDIEEAVFLGERVICIKNGEIFKEITVDLGFPRDTRLRMTTEFRSLCDDVQTSFRDRGMAAFRPDVIQ